MKRLILACLLAVSSHGWASDLNPECHTLYDMFSRLDSRATIARSDIAGEMMAMQCWPALQGASHTQHDIQPATDCGSLVPHVMKMINDDARDNNKGYSLLSITDAKPMTYETIDRVAGGHGLYETVTDYTTGHSVNVLKKLKYNDKIYVRNKGFYLSESDWTWRGADGSTIVKIGNDGTVLVPNNEPFAAKPLKGDLRVLDCSGEARYTMGPYLIQMTLDRAPDGQEFYGVRVLMELR